jgi:hypothetical protein
MPIERDSIVIQVARAKTVFKRLSEKRRRNTWFPPLCSEKHEKPRETLKRHQKPDTAL